MVILKRIQWIPVNWVKISIFRRTIGQWLECSHCFVPKFKFSGKKLSKQRKCACMNNNSIAKHSMELTIPVFAYAFLGYFFFSVQQNRENHNDMRWQMREANAFEWHVTMRSFDEQPEREIAEEWIWIHWFRLWCCICFIVFVLVVWIHLNNLASWKMHKIKQAFNENGMQCFDIIAECLFDDALHESLRTSCIASCWRLCVCVCVCLDGNRVISCKHYHCSMRCILMHCI